MKSEGFYSRNLSLALVVLTLPLSLPNIAQADSIATATQQCISYLGSVAQSMNPDSQKSTQCTALQSTQASFNADNNLWKVWTAVGAVCTIACVMTLATPIPSWAEYACMGLDVGASIYDGVVTHTLTEQLTQIGGVLMMSGMGGGGEGKEGKAGSGKTGKNAASAESKTAETAEDAAKEGKKASKMGLCGSAAYAAYQAYTGYTDSHNDLISLGTLANNVVTYVANTTTVTAGQIEANTVQAANAAGQFVTNAIGSAGSAAQKALSSINPCAGGGQGGEAIIQCAQNSAATAATLIGSPPFQNGFQQLTGNSLSNFLGGLSSPTQGIVTAAAAGAGLSQAQAGALTQALQNMDDSVAAAGGSGRKIGSTGTDSGDSASYGGGGGGGSHAGSGDEEPDLMSMMSGIMAQFGPKEKGGANQNDGVMSIVFAYAAQKKSPALVAENKALSIFDRITYRYYFIVKKSRVE